MNFKRNPILSFMWAAFLSAVLGACAAGNLGDGTEQEEAVFKSRMIAVLNGLPESARDRVAAEMGQAAGKKLVFTHSSRVEWNASVTQSSRNWRQGRRTRRRIRENRIIDARYEGAHLVFDFKNPASRVRGTTARPPAAPGYRTGITQVPGLVGWQGVEHFLINRARGWYYSILLSDIENNDDTDYLALGVWFWLGNLDNLDDRRRPHATAVVSGSDPFEVGHIGSLKGRMTYQGHAVGVYAAKQTTPAFRYFRADVRLTADFKGRQVWGVIMNGTDTATGEPVFGKVELKSTRIPTKALFESSVAGSVDGATLGGTWGGRFFGNGALSTDAPGSVAGTFGARSGEDGKVALIGSIAAYTPRSAPRKNLAPYVVSR